MSNFQLKSYISPEIILNTYNYTYSLTCTNIFRINLTTNQLCKIHVLVLIIQNLMYNFLNKQFTLTVIGKIENSTQQSSKTKHVKETG